MKQRAASSGSMLLPCVVRSTAPLAFDAERPADEDMTFREGQRFVALRNITTRCLLHATRMLLQERDVVIPCGEVLVVSTILPFESNWVWCKPHRYDAFEAEFVDPETRRHPEYHGYSLALESDVIERECKMLEASP